MPDLNDFEFANIHQWEQQVLTDLGLDNIRQITEIRLSEEITQSPYVDFLSTVEAPLERSYRNCCYHNGESWQGTRYWLNMPFIKGKSVSDLNQMALEELAGGADGVIFEIKKIEDHQELLNDVSVADCHIGLHGSLTDLNNIMQFLIDNHSPFKGFAAIDRLTDSLEEHVIDFAQLIKKNHHGFRLLSLKESMAKIGTLEEIARLLSQGIQVINVLIDANLPLDTIIKNLQFHLKVSSHYLWEICRIRCLRMLFHQVITRYGSGLTPESVSIHAFTSDTPVAVKDSPSARDENDSLQLISNTTQAMSAILGGCNALTVLPDSGIGDQTGRRIARNVCHILREECSFHRIIDPVAGSYYLEQLTNKMMRVVWSKLRELERQGGYQTRVE